MKHANLNRHAHSAALPTIMLTAAFSLFACDSSAQLTKRPNVTSLSPRLQPLFEKTKTVCFGRFVITIPVTATVVYGPAQAEMEILYYAGAGDQVAQRLAEHLAIVERERRFMDADDIINLPLFGTVVDGVLSGQKIAYGSYNRVGYTMYSFIPLGKDLFVQHSNSVLPEVDRLKTFNMVASHLRLRNEDEIPQEPGFCINGGFFPMQFEREKVTLGLRLKEFPDVHISIEVQKNVERLAETGRLELMLDEAKEEAEQRNLGAVYARIKTFRRGERQIGAWKGYEFVSRRPPFEKETEAHEFYFESLGAINDPLQPRLDVRLDSGVKKNRKSSVKPSITDEEAIELWDRLLETIRVRQTSDSKPAKGAPDKAPLGKQTVTGGTCSQDGWWQCTDRGEIEGGARRHFKEGETFPKIAVLYQPSLWQRLSGERPKHEMSTVWQLVAYDQTSKTALQEGTIDLAADTHIEQTKLPSGVDIANDPPPKIS